MNWLYKVFAFDLDTCNVEISEYCDANAAGVYQLKILYECFYGDLNKEALAIEKSKIPMFDRINNKLVLKMIHYVINNDQGKSKYVIKKHGNEHYHSKNIKWLVIMLPDLIITLCWIHYRARKKSSKKHIDKVNKTEF